MMLLSMPEVEILMKFFRDYVADDEKSIAIIDTLEYLKSKDLTFQFYLNLLQDLTDMLDDIEPKSDTKIDSDYSLEN